MELFIFLVVAVLIIIIAIAIKDRLDYAKRIKPLKQLSLSERKDCYNDLMTLKDMYVKDAKKTYENLSRKESARLFASSLVNGQQSVGMESKIRNKYDVNVDEGNVDFYISEIKKLI